MTKTEETRLKKFGYQLELGYLLDHFPNSIWITPKEKKFKRRPVSFVITRHDNKWVVTLNTANDANNEVYILHRVVDEKLFDAAGKMILFMEDNKMTEPNL